MSKFILFLVSFFFSSSVFAMSHTNSKYNYTYDIPENWTQTIKNSRVTELTSDRNFTFKIISKQLNKTPAELLQERQDMFESLLPKKMKVEKEIWSSNEIDWTIERAEYVEKQETKKILSFVAGKSGTIYMVSVPLKSTNFTYEIEQVKEVLKTFRFLQPKSENLNGNTIYYTNPFKNYTISYPSTWKKIQFGALFDLAVLAPDEQTMVIVATFPMPRENDLLDQLEKAHEDIAFKDFGTVRETGHKKTLTGEFTYKKYIKNTDPTMAISYSIINEDTKYNVTIISSKENLEKEKNYESIIESFQFLSP